MELPDFISFLAQKFPQNNLIRFLYSWEYLVYSILTASVILILSYLATRKTQLVPSRLQNIAEILVEGVDNFVCGILGPQGRRFTPFIGTIFIYILFMNIAVLIPFMKSATSSLSITSALSLCVFFYVQVTAIRKLGIFGYLDHLSGKPRGVLAFTVVLPIFMFFMHVISELIKPFTLSLRLRSNIMADDMLLGAIASLGIKAWFLLFFCTLLVIVAAVVQAVVFSLLATVYFAIFLTDEEH
jgi:F-type H+-transporting ATPase subunit a